MKQICLEAVSKRYGALPVLSEVNFLMEEGHPAAVTGPSGAGKTTLLRLIAGLERPDDGEIRLEGVSGLGMCFQEDRLLEGFDAVENICLFTGLRDRGRVRDELLRLLPEDALGKPVSRLSGGQRRRIAVVRAALADADALIFDEPFSGLDGESAAATAAYILEKSAGRVLVIAAHEADIPAYCSNRLVLGQ